MLVNLDGYGVGGHGMSWFGFGSTGLVWFDCVFLPVLPRSQLQRHRVQSAGHAVVCIWNERLGHGDGAKAVHFEHCFWWCVQTTKPKPTKPNTKPHQTETPRQTRKQKRRQIYRVRHR